MPVTPESYAWLTVSGLEVAGCVTVVAAADEAKVLAAFGGDSESIDDPDAEYGEWARFTRSGTASVVVEDNGFQGSRSEVIRAASKASEVGKAASIFWNVNDMVVFSCARRGKLLGSVELLDVTEDDLEGIPKTLHRLALRVNDEQLDAVTVGAAMVETFTGARFGPEVLRSGTAHGLTPPPDELRDFHATQMWLYEDRFPDMFDAVLAAAPERQRSTAVFAARAAVREAGLEGERGVAELLDALDTGGPRTSAPVAALQAALSRRATATSFQAIEDQAHGRDANELLRTYLFQKVNALIALRQATHPEPVSAAVIGLDYLLHTVDGSRPRVGAVYREDDSGRWLEAHEDLTRDRREAVAATVWALLQGEIDVDSAVAGLPAPMSDADREAALRDHAGRFERGEFREYQIWRP